MKKLVILPYKENSDGVEEIYMTLRGWESCFFDEHLLIVVGDVPYGNEGFKNSVFLKRKNDDASAHVNVIKSILYALDEYGDGYDDFIVTHDDIVPLHPFSTRLLENVLAVNKAPAMHPNNGNYYCEDMYRTWNLLKKEGVSPVNYTTHTPRIYNIEKFRHIVDKYGLKKNRYDYECLYYNNYCFSPMFIERDNPYFFTIWNESKIEDIKKKIGQCSFVNFANNCHDKTRHELIEDYLYGGLH